MNEFIKKLIERLEEITEPIRPVGWSRKIEVVETKAVIEIVNQLAEEYRKCSKPTCKDCEVYDKEKHYCPKWCELIKRTTEELAEEYNNDVCEWKEVPYYHVPSCNTKRPIADVIAKEFNTCPYCGKKIKVVE